MKRIVLFVEGEGEADAAPVLLSKLVTSVNGWETVVVDPNPFRVGQLSKLTRNNYAEWHRKLNACAKRKNLSGILLLLDGDALPVNSKSFCAKSAAIDLANASIHAGGGKQFSVACVFACKEFESWFIAAIRGFDGLPDGRTISLPKELPKNPEEAPRDAKGWMRDVVSSGYKQTRDQAPFARLLDLDVLRQANLRSFRRMENAVSELVTSARTGIHFVSPASS